MAGGDTWWGAAREVPAACVPALDRLSADVAVGRDVEVVLAAVDEVLLDVVSFGDGGGSGNCSSSPISRMSSSCSSVMCNVSLSLCAASCASSCDICSEMILPLVSVRTTICLPSRITCLPLAERPSLVIEVVLDADGIVLAADVDVAGATTR